MASSHTKEYGWHEVKLNAHQRFIECLKNKKGERERSVYVCRRERERERE